MEEPLYKVVGKKKIEIMKGEELGIYLPILLDDNTIDYGFLFVISGFNQFTLEKVDREDEIYK